MRTGLGISPGIRLASHRASQEITAHPRSVSPIPGGMPAAAGHAAGFRLTEARPGGRTAGPEAAVLLAPGVAEPGDQAAATSEPELNGFIGSARQKCP